MKRALIAFGLIFCLVAASCGGGELIPAYPNPEKTTVNINKSPNIPSGFLTYTDPANYFCISYPQNWEVFPDSMAFIPWDKDFLKSYAAGVTLKGSLFIFGASDANYTGDVNLVIQQVSEMEIRGWGTLEEIVQGRILETRTRVDNFYEHSREYVTLGDNKGILVMWGSTVSGAYARCVQLFTIDNGLVWKLTSNISLSKYDQGKSDIYATLKSFRVLK